MKESIETLLAEAMHLSTDQRMTLAHRMLSSIEPPASAEVEAAWDAEIRRRIARYDAGEVRAIPVAEVFAELDRRLGQ
jgi:putative addiction module component (TIGR02574 family)